MTKTQRATYKARVDKVVERCLRAPRSNWSLFDCVVEEVHGGGPQPTEAQSKIIEAAVHKNKNRQHHATKVAAAPDMDAAAELKNFIDNDADLYRGMVVAIRKNLATKKVKSQYQHDLAVKAFGYLVEAGAKEYVKEFGTPDQPWHQLFDVPTRKAVAEELANDFEGEFELGNYDNLLPKKYQKELSKQHLVPPHRAHSRRKSDLHETMHKPAALRSASDRQLRDFYREEKRDVEKARREASRRGMTLPSPKKSPAQLQREIDAVLGGRTR